MDYRIMYSDNAIRVSLHRGLVPFNAILLDECFNWLKKYHAPGHCFYFIDSEFVTEYYFTSEEAAMWFKLRFSGK